MILIDLQQGTQEWLDWRKPKMSASDVPTILGLNPYQTPFELWAQKVGIIIPADLDKNPNVRRGKGTEDKCRQAVELELGDVLLPLCGEYEHWPILSASFDGVLNSHPYELKAPSKKVYDELKANGTDSPTYKMYEAQVHAQCIVLGSTSGMLYFHLEDHPLLDYVVTLTDEIKDDILNKVYAFWYRVQNKLSPQTDPLKDPFLPTDSVTAPEIQSLSETWLSETHKINEIQESIDQLVDLRRHSESSVIQLMGEYKHYETSDLKVSIFETRGKIDYKRFVEEKFAGQDIESVLEAYRGESQIRSRFTLSAANRVNRDVVFEPFDPEQVIPRFDQLTSQPEQTAPVPLPAIVESNEPYDGYF